MNTAQCTGMVFVLAILVGVSLTADAVSQTTLWSSPGIADAGQIGRGCYGEVGKSLLAAFDDYAEDVRFETAVTLCQAVGDSCDVGPPNGRGNAVVMAGFHRTAYQPDDKGCDNEPSGNVQAAVGNPHGTCRVTYSPSAAAVQSPPPDEASAAVVNPIGFAQLGAMPDDRAGRPVIFAGTQCTARSCPASLVSYKRGSSPFRKEETVRPEKGLLPPDLEGALEPGNCPPGTTEFAPLADAWAGTCGATADPQSVVPNMIGDLFGGPGGSIIRSFDGDGLLVESIGIPNPGAGGSVGQMKIADNTSPLPRDRFLFDYSFFDNVPLYPGGVGVNRFTPGFEKTFADGMASFEMKMPIGITLDSTIVQDGYTDLSRSEFGNLGLTFKMLMYQARTWAYSLGLMTTVPTADDTQLTNLAGAPLIRVKNRAVHVMPFVGFLWAPDDRFFAQGFAQWDVEADSNPVLINQGRGLESAGRISTPTQQYVDVGAGWWLYRGRSRLSPLSGFAVTAELHWDRAMQYPDVVTAGDFRVGSYGGVAETFNLTVGGHFEYFDHTLFTFGYCTPLGGGLDQMFDGELRLMVNRYFGPQTRLTRVPSPR